MKIITVYHWTCPKCQKIITSLHEEQCRINVIRHMIARHTATQDEIEKELQNIKYYTIAIPHYYGKP